MQSYFYFQLEESRHPSTFRFPPLHRPIPWGTRVLVWALLPLNLVSPRRQHAQIGKPCDLVSILRGGQNSQTSLAKCLLMHGNLRLQNHPRGLFGPCVAQSRIPVLG